MISTDCLPEVPVCDSAFTSIGAPIDFILKSLLTVIIVECQATLALPLNPELEHVSGTPLMATIFRLALTEITRDATGIANRINKFVCRVDIVLISPPWARGIVTSGLNSSDCRGEDRTDSKDLHDGRAGSACKDGTIVRFLTIELNGDEETFI